MRIRPSSLNKLAEVGSSYSCQVLGQEEEEEREETRQLDSGFLSVVLTEVILNYLLYATLNHKERQRISA